MMAATAILRDDAIDAEFETLSPAAARVNIPQSALPYGTGLNSALSDNQLDLLRNAFEPAAISAHPDKLTPSFLAFTLIAAFVVFWVSGGRALLY